MDSEPPPSYADVASTTPGEDTAAFIKPTVTLHHDDMTVTETPPKDPKTRRHKVTSKGPWSAVQKSGEETVYENTNGVNGNSLTSVKTPDDFAEALKLDEAERKEKLKLVTGRQPSAGWERSG
jgi:hypothetical protein